jgi:TPR repeat protein
VSVPDDERLAAGKAASDAGRWAEACRLLRPLADAGHPEAQGVVGSLMSAGLHRLDSIEQLYAGTGPGIETATADQAEGGRFLEAASDAGIGPASFNLAGMVVMGYGGGTWDERKQRAADLYAKAHAQGFTAFGWLTVGEGPGQPYLRVMEGYAVADGIPMPGERESDTSSDTA